VCYAKCKHITEQIAGFLAGELTPVEMRALQKWIAESDGNRRYFEEMKAIWQAAGTIDTSETFNPDAALKKVTGKYKHPEPAYYDRRRFSMMLIPPATKRIIRRTLRAAATVALIFSAGALASYFVLKTDIDQAKELIVLSESEYTVEAPRGAKSTVVLLPDGSKVTLNAASKITYATDFGWSSREVSLEGEAYFDVKTNPEKPFTVRTSHLDIQAFGTAFNVKAYPDDPAIVTTLEHGEVKISSRNDNSMDLTMKPKQNVVYYKNDNTEVRLKSATTRTAPAISETDVSIEIPAVTITDQVNVNLYTSWKEAEWLIESKTFSDLADLLERRYDIRIVFGSDEIREYRFSATIRNETIEQVLNALTITAPLKYTIEQGIVRLQIDPKRKTNYDALSQ